MRKIKMNGDMTHIQKAPIDAYEGPERYVFVTYSHKDADMVFPNLSKFDEMGINIFYDEGLPSGSSWFETLETKIKESSLMIPFMSQNTVDSKPSRKEIFLAFRSNIPILPIYVSPTVLEKGLDLAIGDEQSIYQYAMSEEKYDNMCIREFTRHGFLGDNISSTTPVKPNPYKRYKRRMHPDRRRRRSPFFGYGEPKTDKIYVSYPHRDIDLVIPDLEMFTCDGFDIIADNGIEFDENWLERIYPLIEKCKLFVFYITKDSIQLERTLTELKIAQTLNKKIFGISLEKTELDDKMKLFKRYEGEFESDYVRIFKTLLE